MMDKRDLAVGDVVQLSPTDTRSKAFSGCFMVVTDPKSWGAQGYVTPIAKKLDDLPSGVCFYRAHFDEMEYVGKAPWVLATFDELPGTPAPT